MAGMETNAPCLSRGKKVPYLMNSILCSSVIPSGLALERTMASKQMVQKLKKFREGRKKENEEDI